MSKKISVDGTMLIALLNQSKASGTQDAAIDLAVEWIEAAEKEISHLRCEVNDLIGGDDE